MSVACSPSIRSSQDSRTDPSVGVRSSQDSQADDRDYSPPPADDDYDHEDDYGDHEEDTASPAASPVHHRPAPAAKRKISVLLNPGLTPSRPQKQKTAAMALDGERRTQYPGEAVGIWFRGI